MDLLPLANRVFVENNPANASMLAWDYSRWSVPFDWLWEHVMGHISQAMPLVRGGWINHCSCAHPGWDSSAGKASYIQGHVDVFDSVGKQTIHPSWKPFTDGRWHVLTRFGFVNTAPPNQVFIHENNVWKLFYQHMLQKKWMNEMYVY